MGRDRHCRSRPFAVRAIVELRGKFCRGAAKNAHH
jgi:hypothetical protein